MRVVVVALFLFAGVAAQDAAGPEQQLTGERAKLSHALKSATFWEKIGQTQKDELQQVMRAEKFAQTSSIGMHASSDSTAGARLTACLHTRDGAQVQAEHLQRENAQLAAEVEDEQRERSLANETAMRKIAECEVRVNKTMSSTTTHWEGMQQHYAALQGEHQKMQEEVQRLAKFRDEFQEKLQKQKKEQEAKLAELKKEQDSKLAEMQRQDAKVLEAHRVLQKAHEVLQKRHGELEKQAQKDRPNHKEVQQVREESSRCAKDLAASQQAEASLKAAEQKMRADALKQGSQATDAKWQQELKNVTAAKDALELKVREATTEAVAQEKKAKVATKDIPDMELKLRRCLSSRAKTELDLQRVMKRCPQKAAFVQEYVQEWP